MGCLEVLLTLALIASASAVSLSDCGKADIIFLLDGSSSEGTTNFHKQLDFVKNFTKNYRIDHNHIQIGVTTFATSPKTEFNLKTYHSTQTLLHAISRVQFTGGSTNTHTALSTVRLNGWTSAHGGRSGVPKVLVVMTDGQSAVPTSTKTEATKLHTKGVKVISIGIGTRVTDTELRAIASDNKHAFHVASFNALNSIQKEIQQSACPTVPPTVPTVQCDNHLADVVFLLDTSSSEGPTNFQTQIAFVKNFTKRFDIGPQKVQISVVTFASDYKNEFFLNQYSTKTAVLHALSQIKYRSGNTYTDLAIKFIRENSFKAMNGGRTTAPHLVVVLTDGNSQHGTQVAAEAKLLYNSNVKIVSIGIGSGISQTELQNIAVDHSRVLKVSDFSKLSSLLNTVQAAACTAPVECGGQADIVFILDSSSSEGSANFKKQLAFMSSFVKQLDIGPKKVQIGLVTFSSTAHNQFYLNSFHDKTSVLHRINTTAYTSGNTATNLAFQYARNYQFTARHGARANATKIAILLTDGQSQDVPAAISEAHLLKSHHIKVIAVGIGSSINQYELDSVATSKKYVFKVANFNVLNTVKQELTQSTCETKPTPTPSPECGNKEADMVFVLDSSGSEGSTNFKKQLDFVRNFVNQFKIGPQNVQVSVVVFSLTSHEEFPLNRYHDRAALLNAISKIAYVGSSTHTELALEYVRTHSFTAAKGNRPNATDLVIVITDGSSSNRTETKHQANLLKHTKGVEVISVGVGTGISQSELETIATDHKHVLLSANFDALQHLVSELTYATCRVCKFTQKADIMFLLDSSSSEGATNFQKQLDFVTRFVNDFKIGPDGVLVGAVTFSTNFTTEFDLKAHQTKSSLLSAIQHIRYKSGVTNTHLALNYMRTHSFASQHGDRSDADNYVMVLTDGSSSSPNLTLAAADRMKRGGVTILTIGIGQGVNSREINGMASDKKHAFLVNSFNALNTIHDELKQAACTGVQTGSTTTGSVVTSGPRTTMLSTTPSSAGKTTTADSVNVVIPGR